jgi:hypothetical protein
MIIVEFLLEIVGQLVVEVLIQLVGQGVGRVLQNRVVKAVLGLAVAAAVGFGGGYWWGERLTELGRTDPPRSLWVSIGLAAVFVGLAVVRSVRCRPFSERHVLFVPWRWPVLRLVSFAVMNAAAAAGIAAGFTPRALG